VWILTYLESFQVIYVSLQGTKYGKPFELEELTQVYLVNSLKYDAYPSHLLVENLQNSISLNTSHNTEIKLLYSTFDYQTEW